MNFRENYIKNANRLIKESTETFPKERIEQIVEKAMAAFWQEVAVGVPEATTGDFAPMDELQFSRACDVAVRTWLNNNAVGDDDPVM